MRKKVPKCKGCKYHYTEKSIGGVNNWHWCYFKIQGSRNIDSQEIKTSPKWCPLRLGSSENSIVSQT
ncbi:MAG: hypothetical protein N2645_06910 [Clostridia bacterium]|nr:hypothetical protein [Clostridia bacterium]